MAAPFVRSADDIVADGAGSGNAGDRRRAASLVAGRRRPSTTGMEDLGPPVAHLGLAEGVPVYDRSGRRAGVLDRVITDPATGIFKGLLVHTLPLPGRHLYASEDQIAELRERGVLLSVDASELAPATREQRRRRRPRAAGPEHPLQAGLRRLWDRLTGVR
jgi:hypothetical protein